MLLLVEQDKQIVIIIVLKIKIKYIYIKYKYKYININNIKYIKYIFILNLNLNIIYNFNKLIKIYNTVGYWVNVFHGVRIMISLDTLRSDTRSIFIYTILYHI